MFVFFKAIDLLKALLADGTFFHNNRVICSEFIPTIWMDRDSMTF